MRDDVRYPRRAAGSDRPADPGGGTAYARARSASDRRLRSRQLQARRSGVETVGFGAGQIASMRSLRLARDGRIGRGRGSGPSILFDNAGRRPPLGPCGRAEEAVEVRDLRHVTFMAPGSSKHGQP
jgi:hypothetical protein